MAGLGYEIDGDNIYLRFGDYTDIHDSHTPAPECPMPENERLANYTMRLLAMLDLSGWRLVQAVPADQKNPGIHRIRNGYPTTISDFGVMANIDDNLNYLQGYADNINNNISLLQDSLSAITDALTAAMPDGFGASSLVSLQSIIDQLTLFSVDFNAFKLQIDRLYIDTINTSGGGLSEDAEANIEKIADELEFGLSKVGDDGKVPLLDEIDLTLQAEDAAEQVLQLQGETAVYFKSRTVRG